MKFKRHPCFRAERFTRPRSPQRVAAAKRAVQKEKEAMALCPELVTYQTAEERLDAWDVGVAAWNQERRDWEAKRWREARRRLRSLSEFPRKGLIRYWQSDAWLPREATFLLGCIHEIETRHACYWRRLRIRRQLQLLGQGKLPKSVFKAVRAWDA